MQLKLTTLPLMAMISSTIARNCKAGFDYCGHTLTNIGKYSDQTCVNAQTNLQGNYAMQVDQCLYDHGFDVGSDGASQLFSCAGGPNGDIGYITTCKSGCQDAGEDQNDYCL